MRMKRLAAAAAICFVATTASAFCSRDNPTPVVRVVFEDCGELKPQMKIKIGTVTRTAVDKGNYYEADYTGSPVDATMNIVVPAVSGVRNCCFSAEEFPIGGSPNDCYVVFTVTCDKPAWKLSVDSGSPVKLERAHRNELGDPQCGRDGADAVGELSSQDDAILTVPKSSNDVTLTLAEILPKPQLDLRITLTGLLQQAGRPYDRKRLGELLEREAGRHTYVRNLTAAAEPLLARMKQSLPNSVTVKRQ
jgi:hypothetical protein